MIHFIGNLIFDENSGQPFYPAVWKEVHHILGELGFNRDETEMISDCLAQELEHPQLDIFYELLKQSGLDIIPDQAIQIQQLLHNLHFLFLCDERMNYIPIQKETPMKI